MLGAIDPRIEEVLVVRQQVCSKLHVAHNVCHTAVHIGKPARGVAPDGKLSGFSKGISRHLFQQQPISFAVWIDESTIACWCAKSAAGKDMPIHDNLASRLIAEVRPDLARVFQQSVRAQVFENQRKPAAVFEVNRKFLDRKTGMIIIESALDRQDPLITADVNFSAVFDKTAENAIVEHSRSLVRHIVHEIAPNRCNNTVKTRPEQKYSSASRRAASEWGS